MVSRYASVLLTAVLFLSLGACATGRSIAGRESPFQGRAGSGMGPEVTFVITNLAFTQANLYAVTPGSRRHLGRVSGEAEQEFTMSLSHPTEIWMEIDLLAGPTCFTDKLTADPGDIFELTIQNEAVNLYCRRLSSPEG